MICSITLELEGRFDARISGLLEKGGTQLCEYTINNSSPLFI